MEVGETAAQEHSDRDKDEQASVESDDEFDAQSFFDDWIVNLPINDRKMLAVLLAETLGKRFKIKSAALEAIL